MFTETHDIILLIIAGLYLVTWVTRLVILSSAIRAGRRIQRGSSPSVGTLIAGPFWIATALVITAVLW